MNKAIFLDRDGTISKDVHYCCRPEDLSFLPTVEEGLRNLAESKFKIIIITNQSGIGRGYFSEDILKKIHCKLTRDITDSGGRIDGIYYCPHHPDEHCHCRKPNTGMLETAIKDWNIDPSLSYFIGDKYLDIEAANRIGCKAVLVPSEEPEIQLLNLKSDVSTNIDFICANFAAAANWVLVDSKTKKTAELKLHG